MLISLESTFLLVIVNVLCLHASADQEDPVDRILKKRGLRQPHEIRKAEQPSEGNDSSMNSENCVTESNQVETLKDQLKACNKKKEEFLQKLVKTAVNESLKDALMERPYLIQLYRGFLASVNQSGQHGFFLSKLTFEINIDSIEKLEKNCLQNDHDVHFCTNILLSMFKTGSRPTVNRFLSDFLNWLVGINILYLYYVVIAALISFVVLYSAAKLISSNNTILGTIIIIFFVCFLLSVPWEWMRMYKAALAKKMDDKASVPSDCFEVKMSYVSLIKWWFRDTFSFADSPCLKYYDAMVVDPFWEVTPGQAMAAAASNIILQPMFVLSDHFGKCFRIIFKEIPLQWQPLVFIAFIVTFLLVIGIQVYIGGDSNKERLAIEQERNRRLMHDVENWKRLLPKRIKEVEDPAYHPNGGDINAVRDVMPQPPPERHENGEGERNDILGNEDHVEDVEPQVNQPTENEINADDATAENEMDHARYGCTQDSAPPEQRFETTLLPAK